MVAVVTVDRENKAADRVLSPEETKTQERRIVPTTKELTEMLKEATIYLTGGPWARASHRLFH